jgi:hypothetical protein
MTSGGSCYGERGQRNGREAEAEDDGHNHAELEGGRRAGGSAAGR